jgi:hypothetical protein
MPRSITLVAALAAALSGAAPAAHAVDPPPAFTPEQIALAQGLADAQARQLADRAARIRRPDEPMPEARKRVADEAVIESLGASSDPRERAITLSASVQGFYLTNSVARVEYCARHGVDLAPFAAAFARAYGDDHRRAVALGRPHGLDEALVLAMGRATMDRVMDENMRDLAAQAGGLDEVALCEAINANADAFTATIVLAPELRAALAE